MSPEKLIDDGERETLDFALIDADKQNYSNYYELCLKLVRFRGIIAIDSVSLFIYGHEFCVSQYMWSQFS